MRIKEIMKNIFITLMSISYIYLLVSLPYLKDKYIFNNCSLISGENNFLFLIISFSLPVFWFLFSNVKTLIKFLMVLIPFFINMLITFPTENLFWLKVIINEFYICSIIYLISKIKDEKVTLISYFFALILLFPLMERMVKSIILNFYGGVYVKNSFFSVFGKLSPVISMIENNYSFELFESVFIILMSVFIILVGKRITEKTLSFFMQGVFFIFLSFCGVTASEKSFLTLFICLISNLVLIKMITGARLKGFIVASALVFVSFLVVKADIYNIRERPFYIYEISSVYIGDNFSNIEKSLKDEIIATDFNNEIVSKRLTYDIANKVLSYHKSIIKEKNKNDEELFIAYKLKNGKTIIRKY